MDENDHVWLGGHPGALRDLLGIRIEEFGPLLKGDHVDLDLGVTGTLWTDRIDIAGPDVKVLAGYVSGEHAGRPAVTMRTVGTGSASYVSTSLGPDGLGPVLAELVAASGVRPDLPPGLAGAVELAVRTGGGVEYWFLINRTDDSVPLRGVDGHHLAPRQVCVLRRPSLPRKPGGHSTSYPRQETVRA